MSERQELKEVIEMLKYCKACWIGFETTNPFSACTKCGSRDYLVDNRNPWELIPTHQEWIRRTGVGFQAPEFRRIANRYSTV